jgi:tetratricopeptide (TPR) repeat protein
MINKVGMLDEKFGIGNYEDDYYCLRSNLAGFLSVIVADAFIYHYGSQTFKASNVDYAALMEQNFEYFYTKWKNRTDLQSRFARDLVAFGLNHGQNEDYQTALGYFKRALDIKPDHADALKNLGVCLANLGCLPEAMQAFTTYQERYIKDPEVDEMLEQCRQLLGLVATEQTRRNDLCPCGSGKKFKKCCLGKQNEIIARVA